MPLTSPGISSNKGGPVFAARDVLKLQPARAVSSKSRRLKIIMLWSPKALFYRLTQFPQAKELGPFARCILRTACFGVCRREGDARLGTIGRKVARFFEFRDPFPKLAGFHQHTPQCVVRRERSWLQPYGLARVNQPACRLSALLVLEGKLQSRRHVFCRDL